MALNYCALMGRIGNNIELRTTQSGKNVTTFPLAVDRGFKSKDGEKQTDWLNVTVWGQSADFVSRYFQKGSAIIVEGSIQTRKYTDKQGNPRTATEIAANRVHFAGDKLPSDHSAPAAQRENAASQPAPAYSSGSDPDFLPIEDTGDLPF